MPPFLLSLLPSLAKYGLILAAILGIAFAGYHFKSVSDDRAALQTELSQAQEELAAVKAHDQDVTQELGQVIKAQAQRELESNRVRQRINEAPETDNGILAPVVRDELDSLRTHSRSDKVSPATTPGHPANLH